MTLYEGARIFRIVHFAITLSQNVWKAVDRCENFLDGVLSYRTVPNRKGKWWIGSRIFRIVYFPIAVSQIVWKALHGCKNFTHSDNALNVQLLHFPDFNPDP